ncbi:MAG: histidinol dehydrogenase [Acidobacteriaceae bacterium]|nr:histidinol dehydrogenase [Acidobacteriaceae bacterium]
MIPVFDHREATGFNVARKRQTSEVDDVVRPIIEAVRREKDAALRRYATQYDGLGDQPFAVSADELSSAASSMSPEVCRAARKAIANIRQYAEAQMPRDCFREFSPGRKLGWIVRPLDAVGCYIPSGRYPLPSTLLMTAVLAQTAGVRRICVTSPKPSREILGCAHMLGITEFYRIGGAQAIAALALGTETIATVDRIVGPGNAYVAAAKKLLAGEVGIDFIAGPTEIMIIAADGDPRAIAADMLAQAEHDVIASAVLITTSQKLANDVQQEIETQLEDLPTAEVARQSIDNSSAIFVLGDLDCACLFANLFAPEHLSLHDPSLLPSIRNAGTVFLGANTPESAGDYASGPSHVLPTSGVARQRGGLSTADFVKVIAVQELSPSALEELAPTITTLARVEGLEAHARAVEVRFAHQ